MSLVAIPAPELPVGWLRPVMAACQFNCPHGPSLLLHSLTRLVSRGTPTHVLPTGLHLRVCFLGPWPKTFALTFRARLEGADFILRPLDG